MTLRVFHVDLEQNSLATLERVRSPKMEYIDSMGLLQTVMNDLASGQLIQSPELELLDLMGAIEVSSLPPWFVVSR